MMDILQQLRAFFTAPAPPALRRLPSPFPHVAAGYEGRNLHFLLALYLEGRDILERGDSILTSFNFTWEHLAVC